MRISTDYSATEHNTLGEDTAAKLVTAAVRRVVNRKVVEQKN